MKTFLAALLFAFAASMDAANYYVSPIGSGSVCTLAAPCSLSTAAGSGSPASSGDIVWLRGGTYNGAFTIARTGVTYRNYQGERATIDGKNGAPEHTLVLNGSNVTVWGIEFTNTNTNRPFQPFNRPGINLEGSGNRLINNIVHDVNQISFFYDVNGEVYGNLIYYMGNHYQDHGIYTQNPSGPTKMIRHNVLFNNMGHNLHVYGSGGQVQNYMIDGNIGYEAGHLNARDAQRELMLAGATTVNNTVKNNAWYDKPRNDAATYVYPGYGGATTNTTFTNNYVAASFALNIGAQVGMVNTGNFYYGPVPSGMASTFPINTYQWPANPSSNVTRVYPNQYEPGRCNVAVFNWQGSGAVSVDLSGCGLSNGQAYKIQHAPDFFGAAVATGTYSSSSPSVSFPMTGLNYSTPVGFPKPTSVAPEFAAFVVLPTTGGGSTPTPTPTATMPAATATPTRTATAVPPTPGVSTPTPTPAPGSGGVYSEAETGARVAPMVQAADAQASGGFYVSSPTVNAGTVSFVVPSQQAGAVHYIWQRVICTTDTSDSFFVSLDGEADATHINDTCEGAQSPNWQWRQVTDRALGLGVRWARPLSSGNHTIMFRGRDANTKLDQIAVTSDPNWNPATTPTVTSTPTSTPTRTPTRTPTPTPTCTPCPACP